MSERYRTVAAAHLLGGSHTVAEADANAERLAACWNAFADMNVEDPAAFMEEVRGGLDRITDLEQARRSGGPVPEDLDGLDDALAEAVTIAADLLAKMEGK